MDQKNQVRATKSMFLTAKDGGLDSMVGAIEGFCRSVRVRNVSVNGAVKRVADVDINAIVRTSRIRSLFGEEYISDQNAECNTVVFKVTYWGKAAEVLEQYPPQKRQRVISLANNFKLNSYSYNGTFYHSVECTGADFLQTNSTRKEDGESALVGNGAGSAAPAYRQAASNAAPAGQQPVQPSAPYSQPAANAAQAYQQPAYQQPAPNSAPGYQQPANGFAPAYAQNAPQVQQYTAPGYANSMPVQYGNDLGMVEFDDDSELPF